MKRAWASLAVILLLIDNLIDPTISLVCKCIIYSSLFKSEGLFTSPNYPSPYHLEAKPYLCLIYFFLGTSKQIVEITFDDIDIAERENGNCDMDYIEIYDEELISKHLITSSLNAHFKDHDKLHDIKWRYDNNTILCGNNNTTFSRTTNSRFSSVHRLGRGDRLSPPQTKFYASKNVLVFIFFASHGIRHKLYKGFKGIFKFLNKDAYENKGIKIKDTQCSYRYDSTFHHLSSHIPKNIENSPHEIHNATTNFAKRKGLQNHNNNKPPQNDSSFEVSGGYLYSPNYPKSYPPNSYCQYVFYGHSLDEYIYLRLEEVYLDNDNTSCIHASDQIRVYDGDTNMDPMIAQICSSTGLSPPFLNSAGMEIRKTHLGFPKEYRSSGNKLLIIFSSDNQGNNRGFKAFYEFRREDHNIFYFTRKGQQGCDLTISSSNSLNGTLTSPNYPKNYPSKTQCTYHFTGKGRERVKIKFLDFDLYHPLNDPNSCEDVDTFEISTNKNDEQAIIEEFCGQANPPAILSNGHTLNINFRGYTSSPNVRGFKFEYAFVTDFAMTNGKQDTSYDCAFEFNSLQSNNGTFTSPNFPGLYPRDTECYYFFYGLPEEKVRIIYLYFDIEGIFPCVASTESDYLEFSNYRSVDRKFPRYCGENKPPTIESDSNFFRVTFKSNSLFDATGFEAHYQFFQPIEDKIYYNYPKGAAASSYYMKQSYLSAFSMILLIQVLLGDCK